MKTNLYKQIIEKMDELIVSLDNGFGTEMVYVWHFEEVHRLQSELKELKAELKTAELAEKIKNTDYMDTEKTDDTLLGLDGEETWLP